LRRIPAIVSFLIAEPALSPYPRELVFMPQTRR